MSQACGPAWSVGNAASGTNAVDTPSGDQSSSNAGTKQPASSTDAIPPPSKRPRSTSSTALEDS